jgi:hypothetical protein
MRCLNSLGTQRQLNTTSRKREKLKERETYGKLRLKIIGFQEPVSSQKPSYERLKYPRRECGKSEIGF